MRAQGLPCPLPGAALCIEKSGMPQAEEMVTVTHWLASNAFWKSAPWVDVGHIWACRERPGWGRRYLLGQLLLCSEGDTVEPPRLGRAVVAHWGGKNRGCCSDMSPLLPRWANGYSEEKPLSVPRDTPFQLETCPLTAVDALVLRFFLEYQWFVDFAVYSGGVYLFTEAYYYMLGPAKETNIAVFWCLLTIAFSIKVFLTVTRLYFSAEEGGERSVCLTFAFLFLLLAMLVQVVREETLELGLEPGLDSMTQNLEPLLKTQDWDWALPLVKLVIRVGLAAVGSMLGAFLTFPGLRLAQTHHDALTMSEDRPMLQLLLHTSFLSPLFVLWFWTKPIARDFLHQAPFGSTTVSLLSDSAFDSLRLWVLVALCLLRLAVTRPHLQAYLCLAKSRVEQLRREAGRIEAREIQRRVSAAPRTGRRESWALGRAPGPSGVGSPGLRRSLAAATATCPPGGAGVLLRDGCESAVPDAAHPHPQLHAAAQDAGWLLLGSGPGPLAVSYPILSPRWPGWPGGGRGPANCCPDRWGPGQPAHAPLPPWRPRLPHLVDRRLPTALQPLWPVLPPAPGGLLAVCRYS
uniref:Transmembrane protein 161A n=1 Tax=Sus scrofa TaxID=9823 RepID=A0A8D1Y7M9_PIG